MSASLFNAVSILGSALLHFVWQGALIGAVTALGLFSLRNAKAQTRYLFGCAALLFCIALPLAHIAQMTQLVAANQNWQASSVSQNDTKVDDKISQTNSGPLAGSDIIAVFANVDALWESTALKAALHQRLPLLVSLWAVGVALMALRMGAGLLWVRRRVEHGAQHSDPVWQAKLNQMALSMGIRRGVRLGVSNQIASPVTAGWWHPIVILPAALMTGMPVDLLEALLAHELGHVKRVDYLVNLLQSAIEIVLFYHPVVWWLSKQIRIEREQIADDLAARLLGEPRRLALALSELEQFQFSPPQLAQAAHGGNLMSRIKHLVSPELPIKVFSWKLLIPLAGLSAACAVLVAQVGVASAQSQIVAANNNAVVPVKSAPNQTAVSVVSAVAPPANRVGATTGMNGVSKNATTVATTSTESPSSKSQSQSQSQSQPYPEPFALIKTSADETQSVANNSGFNSKEIDILRKRSKAETLWFRESGKSFAIREQAILDQVRDAYKPMDALGVQMDLQGKKMDEQGKIMEEIGKQMEAASTNRHHFDNSAFETAMRSHEKKMAEFEKKMALAVEKISKVASNEARSEVQEKISDIQIKIQELAQKMQAEQQQIANEHKKLSTSLEPLSELGKKMTEAGKPMTELGKEMNILGKKMDVLAKQAEKQVKEIIRIAKEKGLAIPVNDI